MPFFTALLLLALASTSLSAQDAPATQPAAAPAAPSPETAPSAQPTPTATPTPTPAAAAPAEDVIPVPPNAGPAGTPIVSEAEMPAPAKPAAPGTAPLPDSAFTDPNGVIPDAATPPASRSAGPSVEEVQRKTKIRYREVRTQIEKDPDVLSLLSQAQKAKNFEDERAAYREYYRLLFKKMKKADKTLTDRCNAMETAYLSRLAQYRVEPTIPLNLPPKPEPLGN